MNIEKTIKPYELLVRWRDGVISGAHVQFIESLVEDGVVLSQREGPVMPVSMAGEAGFPLHEILSAVHASALSDFAQAQIDLKAKQEELEAAKIASATKLESVKQAHFAEMNERYKQIDDLNELLSKLQAQHAVEINERNAQINELLSKLMAQQEGKP